MRDVCEPEQELSVPPYPRHICRKFNFQVCTHDPCKFVHHCLNCRKPGHTIRECKEPKKTKPGGGKGTDTTTPQPVSSVSRTATYNNMLTNADLYDPTTYIINSYGSDMLCSSSNELTTANQHFMGKLVRTEEQSKAQVEHKFTRELLELESKTYSPSSAASTGGYHHIPTDSR